MMETDEIRYREIKEGIRRLMGAIECACGDSSSLPIRQLFDCVVFDFTHDDCHSDYLEGRQRTNPFKPDWEPPDNIEDILKRISHELRGAQMTVNYTHECPDKGWRINCDVSAKLVEGLRATHNCPGEPSHLEDVSFDPQSFEISVGTQWFDIPIDDELHGQLSKILHEDFVEDPDFEQELFECFTLS